MADTVDQRRATLCATAFPSSTSCGRASACSAACSSPGLVLTAVFILVAIFAPWHRAVRVRAAARSAAGSSARSSRRARSTCSARPSAATTCSPASSGARRPRSSSSSSPCCSRSSPASLLGLVSGYFGGWLDRVLVVIADAIYAFPSLLLAIVAAIVISGGQSSLGAAPRRRRSRSPSSSSRSTSASSAPRSSASRPRPSSSRPRCIGASTLAHHVPPRVPQRDPHAAADLHAQRLRGDR